MQNVEDCIERVWENELEIMDVIHKICKDNDLRYSLMFGTLLGAVRHKGFIPWDDDIDIMMPREDYEKLLTIWNSVAPEGYLLQNKRTDLDFTQNFTKIRKDKTAFIQSEEEKNVNYHTGIFVDIFPADRVAPKGIRRKFQYGMSALNLLYSRSHSSGRSGIVGLGERVLLSMPLKLQQKIFCFTERMISLWDNESTYMWFSPNTIEVCKRYFPATMFDEFGDVLFNDREYCAIKNKKTILKRIYGDFMKLPPEEDRVWKHHPIFIDFERNYK